MTHAAVVASVSSIRGQLLDLITNLGDDRKTNPDRDTDLLVDELLTAANQLGGVETNLSADRPRIPSRPAAPIAADPPYLMPDVGTARTRPARAGRKAGIGVERA